MLDRRGFIGGAGHMAAGGVALAMLPSGLAAQSTGVLDDMAVLRGALKLHPGLHRYNTPREIEGGLMCLETALARA
ncbi:MAG TPA: twin-arginine translocation signal domain-containing protein, partial [Erythrobacter sp.]|nr:twin-arginine translocation signal domain-containing protein [Erythrobacter sp.]